MTRWRKDSLLTLLIQLEADKIFVFSIAIYNEPIFLGSHIAHKLNP